MSPRRLENLDAERQRRLFEAAAEEFAAHGFERASLNRILERSGMGKSSLYYYFDDKSDLFATMLERSAADLFRQAGELDLEALNRRTFWPALEERYRAVLALIEADPRMARFGGMFYGLRSDPRQGAALGRLFELVRRWVVRIVERGRQLGVVRSDLPGSLLVEVTMGLFESVDRWGVDHWEELSGDQRQALPATHVGLFRDLLAPRRRR